MLKKRIFNIVCVTKGHGVGVESYHEVDKVIHYDGKEITVEIR